MSDLNPTPAERPEPWTESGSAAGGREPLTAEQRSVLDPPTVHTPPPAPPFTTSTTGSTTGSTTPRDGTADLPVATAPVRRPMRLRTVVLGLVLLTIAVLTLVGALTEVRLSLPLVTVAILVGAGFVLVAGGLSAAFRESAGRPPA